MGSMLSLASVVVMLAGGTAAGGTAAQDQTVYKIGDGIKAPVLVHDVKPRYTEGAIRRRVEGTVLVKAVVLTDGTVGDIAVVQSLDDELDQEALTAAKQWTFRPGTKDGKPVAVEVNIELTFTLKK